MYWEKIKELEESFEIAENKILLQENKSLRKELEYLKDKLSTTQQFFDDDAYGIKHNITGRMYIGSSGSIKYRIRNHIYALRNHKHPVELMQKDFDEYGEDYTFYHFKFLNKRWTNPTEKWLQYVFKTGDPQFGYNYKEKLYSTNLNTTRVIPYREIFDVDLE